MWFDIGGAHGNLAEAAGPQGNQHPSRLPPGRGAIPGMGRTGEGVCVCVCVCVYFVPSKYDVIPGLPS